MDKTESPVEILNDSRLPLWKRYALMTAGTASLAGLARYELVTGLFCSWPGALGYLLRRMFYRVLFHCCGKRVTIGRNVVLRGARRISMGSDVFIEDNCCIDASCVSSHISIGDRVFIGRNSIVRCRGKELAIGCGTRVGSNCIIATDSRLSVGTDVLIGAFTYLAGGGTHKYDNTGTPIINQPCESKGGIIVGNGAWLGARVTVLDGCVIGAGAAVGANALVTKSIPEMSVCYGSPAKVMKMRNGSSPR